MENSGLPTVQLEFNMEKTEMEIDPETAFAAFDFAQPPIAEIQILRVLEASIQRKKKAQTAQAI